MRGHELIHLYEELDLILEEIQKLSSNVRKNVKDLESLQNQRDYLEKLIREKKPKL